MNQRISKFVKNIPEIAAFPIVVCFWKLLSGLILWIVSPTLMIAKIFKPRQPKCRSIVIIGLNWFYLLFALTTLACAIIHLDNSLEPLRTHVCKGWYVWAWFLVSRCTEVFLAFYRDAIDKLNDKQAASDLTPAWRVRLALNSYVELIIDYALLYALLTPCMWSTAPIKITEALWISASTITTSGSAGYPPIHWLPQFLSTFEIFSGVILLVVCFTIYVGKNAEKAAGND